MTGSEMSPYAQKVQHGLAIANRRLMERQAKLGESLVIGCLDGTCKEVPAADFLEESRALPWWQQHFGSEESK